MTIHDAWWLLVCGALGFALSVLLAKLRPPVDSGGFIPTIDLVGVVSGLFVFMASLLVGALLWALDVTLLVAVA